MTRSEFDKRVKLNGGCDRVIDNWKIIDIHIIPEIIEEYHELDFYCGKNDKVVLLRIRAREVEKYEIIENAAIDYWIAELPINKIDNNVIISILSQFETLT